MGNEGDIEYDQTVAGDITDDEFFRLVAFKRVSR